MILAAELSCSHTLGTETDGLGPHSVTPKLEPNQHCPLHAIVLPGCKKFFLQEDKYAKSTVGSWRSVRVRFPGSGRGQDRQDSERMGVPQTGRCAQYRGRR